MIKITPKIISPIGEYTNAIIEEAFILYIPNIIMRIIIVPNIFLIFIATNYLMIHFFRNVSLFFKQMQQ